MSGPYGTYAAVVVGAGPAGVTCVGNLLERKIEPILWVDDRFNGGRVNAKYREVPSNTRVALFIDFATAVAPFRRIVSGMPARGRWEEAEAGDGVVAAGEADDKLAVLRGLEQGKGCELSYAADMIVMLTEGLKRTPGVIAQQGRVSEAVLDEETGNWTVNLQADPNPSPSAWNISTVQAKRLVLCTGSSPTATPLPVQTDGVRYLDLDAGLSPTLLSETLAPLGPTTVSVVGASHSAILVLRNLYNLARTSKPDLKIKWFTRHGLRYAEFMDGWILRDNTGLKGEVAGWAKANLEPDVFDSSDVSTYIEKIAYERGDEAETFAQHMQGGGLVCQAIGYTRDAIPTLKTEQGKPVTPFYNHETGSFDYVKEAKEGAIGDLSPVPGMFGAGIAYPERVTDPHGNVEYAVGFFKFMKFVKKVSPMWN